VIGTARGIEYNDLCREWHNSPGDDFVSVGTVSVVSMVIVA